MQHAVPMLCYSTPVRAVNRQHTPRLALGARPLVAGIALNALFFHGMLL